MIILRGKYWVKISVRLIACPKDHDLEVFKKINQPKFSCYGISTLNVDLAAGWALTRETGESTTPCLLIRIIGAEAYTPVIEFGIVDCSARHPYIHFVLQGKDSGDRVTLLINTNVYSLNYEELHKAWKRTELFKVVVDNCAKKSENADVICMQVEKVLENFEDTLAKKKKGRKEESSVVTEWTQQNEAPSASGHSAKKLCKGFHDLHAVKDAKMRKAVYIAELNFELITEQSELDLMGDPDLRAVKIEKLQKAIYIEELKLKVITAESKLDNLNAMGGEDF